ncbi:MAG: 50S ribosomal protein L3 [Verrucomicrobiota bacterium]|jgi:large subunit ribosomal protein L3
MPLGLLAKKLGSTRVYDPRGVVVPVTVVLAGPNRVLQVKTQAGKDGYNAVQLGFGSQKPQRIAKPALGHLVKHGALDKAAAEKAREKGDKTALAGVAKIKEFRNFSREVKPGDIVGPALFTPGDFVDAIGLTKGRGFEGVVKRHGFRGGDSTHGAKGWHRRIGAIGQRLFPGTVMRGLKMPGHMGQVQRTTQNLEVIQVREAENLLLIKGAIPGAEGDYVIIRESKKRPKGWKPPVSTAPMKRKGGAAAKAEPKPAAAAAAAKK